MQTDTSRFWRGVAGYQLLAALVALAYVGIANRQNGEFGFPLDDAWIHQVYARNLGTRGEFSFFPGQPSAGSTSPLWAILLASGYALHIDFRVWTILLGILFLGATGWVGGRVAATLVSTEQSPGSGLRVLPFLVSMLLIFEWHMVWAAASGMEILLFVFLMLALVQAFWMNHNAAWAGLLAGLLTLTRPEGVILAGLVGIGLLIQTWNEGNSRLLSSAIKRLGSYGIAFVLPLIPYLVFNDQVSGTILPNTFYAKASEYAELTTQSHYLVRWLSMYRQPLIGGQLLLVPGLLYLTLKLVRERCWIFLIPLAWIVILPVLYAARLPVEYQFGRYMMPIIPFIIVYGVVGTAQLYAQVTLRIVRRAWVSSIAALQLVFLLLGGLLYAQSVAVVNCEMVATARWTADNLPRGALVAAHDIGAQGYFDARPILDLAGLVSPEVIPFIRDEGKLREWVQTRGAHYAIFFPTWYPNLGKDPGLEPIHVSGCTTTRTMGEEDLVVYSIKVEGTK